MKLYFAPFTCSMAVQIALEEAGLDFTTEKVDFATKQTATGADFRATNPNGYVPALQLDDGTILTEAAALLQFVADSKPEANLAPRSGLERAKLNSLLTFISTECHKGFSPLFNPKANDEYKAHVRETIGKRYTWLSTILEKQDFIAGSSFTVADAYLFTVLGWTRAVQFDLTPWPAVKAYQERIGGRPAVQKVLAAQKTPK